MVRGLRAGWLSLALVVVCGVASSHASLRWGERRGTVCEPPNVFYSSRHSSGVTPCCPTDDGVCPGGAVCPPSGVCAVGGAACIPNPIARPNIVLMIGDDHGECFYGNAKECRSAETGTPIPPPATPALDSLAAGGTVFAIAHNTAAWCYPSLNSILTGRYQRSFGGGRSGITDRYTSVGAALGQLGRAPGTVPDPFDDASRIGGYCTLQGGKFTASSGRNPGFDASLAHGSRQLGRIDCAPGQAGGPPRCGSEMAPAYNPFAIDHMGDLFEFMDSMVYRKPGGAPGEYTMQQFFAWYAPRIPHQPLRAPKEIDQYLFGANGMGGIFGLQQLCPGGACGPAVAAFNESNFGTVREYYANVYLADANVAEIRKFLARTGAPHCIGSDGRSRFQVESAGACNGTWATVSPAPDHNTIMVYMSDNGWHLPHSKHNFSENGYRTRLIVFDPRNPTSGTVSDAMAHSTDVLPSLLGFALDSAPGTQSCPTSDFDDTPCDGRDFRGQLGPSPQPASALRRSLCGHETRRSVSPSRGRYLLTGVGTVGRCALANANECATDLQCGAAQFCLAGRCAARSGLPCSTNAQCSGGNVCLDNKCQAAPCIDDAPCESLLGANGECVAETAKWCANAPDVTCTTRDDCPACPTNGPCRRLCEPRRLKMYEMGGNGDMTDLFVDPDEERVHENGPVAALFSDENGPYGSTLRQLACCIDDWWDGNLRGMSICAGQTCPAALTCNQ